MWTGLGVIYFVILLAVPIVKGLGTLLIGSALEATSKHDTKKKLNEANKIKEEQLKLNQNRNMSDDFRQSFLKQYPDSVIVGEVYNIRREWRDGRGWVYPFTIDKREYYWSSKKQPPQFIRRETECFTKSIYEYIEKVEFLDDITEDEWCHQNCVTKHTDYEIERMRQCEQYCVSISMLAHKYIYFGQYTEFKRSFILALIRNKELTLKFIRECHVANKWKEANRQIYDCDNYMQDFMIENRVQSKIDAIAGHQVKMPNDFRYFRPNTPSTCAAKHIDHELKKRGRIGQAEQAELKSQSWWGAALVSTIVWILFLIWFFTTPTDDITIHFKRIGFVVGLVAWALVIGKASVGSNASNIIKSEDSNEEYYKNPFPTRVNKEGAEFGKTLSDEILQHPAPYKYYDWKSC